MADGIKLWEGKSRLTGKPIKVIATGIKKGSKNKKTGEMVQVWIMPASVDPCTAIKMGRDEDVCGDCEFRLAKNEDGSISICYVRAFHGPQSVYRADARGGYPGAMSVDEGFLEGYDVRIGSWGDPSAVPFKVWDFLLGKGKPKGWTSYTRQWMSKKFDPRVGKISMLSVHTPDEYRKAQKLGLRTFRTRLASDPIFRDEIMCPASKEAGYKSTCEKCNLCNGTREGDKRKNIVIVAHGIPAKVNAYKALRRRLKAEARGLGVIQ